MWYYRMKLVQDVLIPLSKKNASFKENLILKEISSTAAYINRNKNDASAKHYFMSIKTSFQFR